MPTDGARRDDRPVEIALTSWRQFGHVEILLHDRLTVLVGPNGTGKSTILSMLALLLDGSKPKGEQNPKAEEPAKTRDARVIGVIRVGSGLERVRILAPEGDDVAGDETLDLASIERRTSMPGSFHHATKLLFGRRFSPLRILGEMLIPVGGSSGNRAYVTAKHIVGFAERFLPSERSLFGSMRKRWEHWALFSSQSTSLLLQPPHAVLERVAATGRSPEQVFDRFSQLFVTIVGESSGIHRIGAANGELVAFTRQGSFSFDAISHGLALIATLLWDCVLLDAVEGGGLMLIDEPENHLHPGLQRKLMTTLVDEFPSIQFVVATHSPFFVGAARSSRVCLLTMEDGGYVHSRMLSDRDLDRGGTANDVLREALGTTTSRPLWLEDELRQRVSRYASREPDKSVVESLHQELRAEGQSELLPDAIRILKQLHDKREMA